ncbi:MAG: hypothetical protein ACQEV7_02535 [Bacillota bacterium]
MMVIIIISINNFDLRDGGSMTLLFVGTTIVAYSILMKVVLKSTCEPKHAK